MSMFDLDYLHNEFLSAVNNAIDEHNISTLFVAYSGGHDSAVVMHLASKFHHEIKLPIKVMTIDTGISSKGHLARLRDEVQKAGFDLKIYTGEGRAWFLQKILDFGFPYTPMAHSIYYRMLKERAIMTCLREAKTHRLDRVGFITGVRRLESVKRAKTPIIYRNGSRVSINAIATYDDNNKNAVMADCDWWQGCTTNDCYCNWHGNYTTDDLTDEQLKQAIEEINTEMKSLGLWGYGERPTPEQVQLMGTIETLEMPVDSFCINCISKSQDISGKRANKNE